MNDERAPLERRDFIGRALAAIAGVWIGRGLPAGRAEAATAQDQPFIGEIRMFAGNFAPVGWAFCNGQMMSIFDNETLFNLIGTTYGGDGQTTFALPDLRGRAPVHVGPFHQIGQLEGTEALTLTTAQIPSHAHTAGAYSLPGDSSDPAGRVPARNAGGATHYDGGIGTTLAAGAIASAGGSQPHENMQPFLAVNFIISLFGVFPSQS